jgi:uncharacterized protein (TIGR02246 family)
MRDPEAVVDEQIAAYAAGDADRFAAQFAADAVCAELPSGMPIAVGRDEIRRVWGAVFARGPRTIRILGRLVQGGFVIDREQVTVAASGQIVDALAVYEVGDGLIQRLWLPPPVVRPGVAASDESRNRPGPGPLTLVSTRSTD